MTTTEERLAALEQGFENEREWRREMLNSMREMNAKIDRLYIAVLIGTFGIIAAVIASNWIG